MGKKPKHGSDRLSRLLRLYASLPRLECRQLCQESCGPVVGSRLEHKRLVDLTHREPGVHPDLTCVYLADGQCSVYEARPMICRLWGMVEGRMECPHGCQPVRWLSDAEGMRILREAQYIGGDDPDWYRQFIAPLRAAVEAVQSERKNCG